MICGVISTWTVFMCEMRELDFVIRGRGEVRGFTFTRIAMSPYAYVYKQVDDETGDVLYEVFRRVENRQFGCVSYPKSNGFGDSIYMGKVCSSIRRAMSYFGELNDYCSKNGV